MALRLPRLVIRPDRPPAASDGFPTDLIEVACALCPVGPTTELVTPCGPGRWLVGRGNRAGAVVRLVERAEAERIGSHPAWLWTADPWFDPGSDDQARPRAPAALPLRHVVRLMAPLGRRSRRTIKALAAVVAQLRAGHRVYVAVEPDLLASASHPARWFVLSLLACLPPARREPMRVAVTSGPPPTTWPELDLAVGPASLAPTGPGLVTVHVSDPPDEGEDLVAYFVRNRLYDDDPEAVESAAWLYDGDGDRWGDGIAALIREGVGGVGSTEVVVGDPERAVRGLVARLRAGALVDAAMIDELVRVTLVARDARPWSALARRSPIQRADAVDALLAHAASLEPGAELVAALAAIYPRGAPLERWLPALLGWLVRGCCPPATVTALEATLLEWPLAATGPTRASVWAEVVRCLVALGRGEQASDALVSPLAAEIARDGAGRALVAGWALVPRGVRTPARLDRFVGLLHGVPDGDLAVSDLFRLVRHDDEEARALIRAWIRRSVAAPTDTDPLFALVREGPWLRTWAEALLDEAGPGFGDPGTTGGRLEPLWAALADAVVERAVAPREALLGLVSLPISGRAVAHALRLLGAALEAKPAFPDPELASVAEAFAQVADADPAWAWVAVAAAAPDVWEEEVVDGTVSEVLSSELGPESRAVVSRSLELLGAAAGYEPLDLARWGVRLVLSAGGRSAELVPALLRGLRARDGAEAFLATTLDPLVSLVGEDGGPHPALAAMIVGLGPAGWHGAPVGRVFDAVGVDRLPPELVVIVAGLVGRA